VNSRPFLALLVAGPLGCASSGETLTLGKSNLVDADVDAVADVGQDVTAPPSFAPDAGDAASQAETGPPPGVDAGPGCSGDLQSVVGADGGTTDCPGGMLCAAGHCEDACQATRDAHVPYGCEFYVSPPSVYGPQPCHVARIHNVSSSPIQFTVSRAGHTFDLSTVALVETGTPWNPELSAIPAQGVPPGYAAVVFLSGDPLSYPLDCSNTKAVNGPANIPVANDPGNGAYYGVSGFGNFIATGTGQAFHIETTGPAMVYAQLVYGGKATQTDMTSQYGVSYATAAAIPAVGAWATTYATVSPQFIGSPNPAWWYPLTYPNTLRIVAEKDATQVTVKAQDDLPGGGGVPTIQHTTQATVTLDAGEFVQWGGLFDLAGTTITSNSPVGVITGSIETGIQGTAGELGMHCVNCGSISYAVDAVVGGGIADEPLPPPRDWGNEYVGIPLQRAVDELTVYEAIAAQPGTTLDFDPPQAGAPTEIGPTSASWFIASTSFRVRSQDTAHPFFIAQVASGGWLGSLGHSNGAHFLPLVPTDRYVKRVPMEGQLPLEYEAYELIRERTPGGFLPVQGPCGLVAESDWMPVGTEGRFQYTLLFGTNGGNELCGVFSRYNLDGTAFTSESPLWVFETHDLSSFYASNEWLAWSRTYGPRGASAAVFPSAVDGGGAQ
jgi:hypothetical protein